MQFGFLKKRKRKLEDHQVGLLCIVYLVCLQRRKRERERGVVKFVKALRS